MTRLTPRQRRFVEEYLIDLNATQAASRAGYKNTSAFKNAHRLLKKPHVRAALDAALEDRAERATIKSHQVVEELAHLAFANMADYVDFSSRGVNVKDIAELPDGAARSIAEVSESKTANGGTIKFKLHDKLRALDALAKHLGLYRDQSGASATGENNNGASSLSETERTHRLVALFDAARTRRDRPAADERSVPVAALDGSADPGADD